ncbi:DMT family transporter [Gramella sp. AN32]|uniref:DMT family transporter n=1 Tax=Christiangramia antarctica TaxID=2058158 RepID=A0ABW5X4C6_9FLAO|nr:DMT family transporter [Gramella sp. AN32]MCM4155580.1 EamA family transporter [Gramella sp. AN32]
MSQNKQYFLNILQLNIAVLFISTSGVLGRYIALYPIVTIFYRTLLAVVIFYAYCKWKKIDLKLKTPRDKFLTILGGVLMGIHWVTYFFSLQYSTVAIAILSIFTYPVITAFLEPVFLKSNFNKIHLLLGVLVITGVYFLSPEIDFKNKYFIAVIFGIISAIFYSLRNILMKKQLGKYSSSSLMFYQILVICICLSPMIFFSNFSEVAMQWKPLLILAVLTTCIGHTMFVRSFKNFSITTASIMSSVQPIYGIILAVIFLNEIPSPKVMIGGALILSAVLIESFVGLKKT